VTFRIGPLSAVGLQNGCSRTPSSSLTTIRAVPAKAPAGVRGEIVRQQRLDANWGQYQDTLEARVAAVVGARPAFAERQVGADWALRQSLIDLASVCELLADELPPPAV
jgi:hypothetical protein